MNVDEIIGQIAARQDGHFTSAQATSAGVDHKSVERRVAKGLYTRVHQGVYRAGTVRPTRRQRYIAAVLRGGAGAGLSHTSAARYDGFWTGADAVVHVTVPSHKRPQPGIRWHVSPAAEMRRNGGMMVTVTCRTIIDLGSMLRMPEQIARIISEANRLCGVSPAAMEIMLERYRGKAGIRMVRAGWRQCLGDAIGVDGPFEEMIVKMFPDDRPVANARICAYRVDAHWPDCGLIVEPGGRHHENAEQQVFDAGKDEVLEAGGWEVIRFDTYAMRHPQYVKERITRALARRRAASVDKRATVRAGAVGDEPG